MSGDHFWEATERVEESFLGAGDVVWFRSKMLKLGHTPEVIRDRVAEIHPSLVTAFDRVQRNAGL